MSNILEIKGLKVMYGKSIAVHDVNISVPEGGIVTLIGSNGAGKSTTLNAALGIVPATEGQIFFGGEDVTNASTAERVRRGLVPAVIEDIGQKIKEINQTKGTSILLVEQNVHLAFGAASYCYTLQVGEIVAEGTVEEIRSNDVVKKAYFGG